MKTVTGPLNGAWNPFSVWSRRLRVIQEARALLRYKIAARLDRVKNLQAQAGHA